MTHTLEYVSYLFHVLIIGRLLDHNLIHRSEEINLMVEELRVELKDNIDSF